MEKEMIIVKDGKSIIDIRSCVTKLKDGEYDAEQCSIIISDLPIDDEFAPFGSYVLVMDKDFIDQIKILPHPKNKIIYEANELLNKRYDLEKSIKSAIDAQNLEELIHSFRRAGMENYMGNIEQIKQSFIEVVKLQIVDIDNKINDILK